MSEEDETKKGEKTLPARRLTPVVVRSAVPAGLPYKEYRPFLRRDFWYSCAYCTMMESEAQAIRFAIDHYEPTVARPDLENEYANLMYACDECNARKGDRYPPLQARGDGHRFFRTDEDVRSEHFLLDGTELHGTTNVGNYTIDAVDLNRGTLMRLRKLRKKLLDYDGFIDEGITALTSFPIDRLDPQVRAQAIAAINKAFKTTEEFFDSVDEMLRKFAKSVLLSDGEPEEKQIEQDKGRLARLKELEGIYPGAWRGRKHRKRKH